MSFRRVVGVCGRCYVCVAKNCSFLIVVGTALLKLPLRFFSSRGPKCSNAWALRFFVSQCVFWAVDCLCVNVFR